jgi:hypothetical protein
MKSKGAPGLAFETWDPSNQFLLETPAFRLVMRRVPGFPTSRLSPQTRLSSRPERTRISCRAALETTACGAFSKESRMRFTNATNINRKSGAEEWRYLRFLSPGFHTPHHRFPFSTAPG